MPTSKDTVPIDLMLIGEFCEKDGPVVRHLFALGESGRVECYPIEVWPRGADEHLHQFMMRAMSGDHVYPERGDAPLQYRACEVLMDRVKWIDDTMLLAYVSSVTLFDVFARGYARTACVAYLSNDEHKMFTISHWLSMECQAITRKLFDSTFLTHKMELVQCCDALELIKKAIAEEHLVPLPQELTDRHKNGLQAELEALRSRVMRSIASPLVKPSRNRRGTALNRFASEDPSPATDGFEAALGELRASVVMSPSPNPSTLSGSVAGSNASFTTMSLTEAIDIINRLVTVKGSRVLRPMETICAQHGFDDVHNMIQRTMWAFALDTVWLMENMIQVMRPLPDLLEQPLAEILAAQWPTHEAHSKTTLTSPSYDAATGNTTNAFMFKIGDCVVVDPYLRRCPPPPQACDHELFTFLLDGALFSVLREYGVQPVLSLMYHALACRPIVVCGDDEADVLQAMRLAATFIPGVLQSKKRRLGVGILPFGGADKSRVTFDQLERYAVLGCPVHAILEEKTMKPFLPRAFVWHVQSAVLPGGKRGFRCRTVTAYGTPYNVSKPTANAAQSADRLAAHVDPFDATFSNIGSPAVGLLTEVFDLLSLKVSTRGEEHALTNFLRLTLKRIFLDYGTMAASVMNSLLHEATMKSVVLHSGYLNSSSTSPGLPNKRTTGQSSVGTPSLHPQPGFPGSPPPNFSNNSITSMMGATLPPILPSSGALSSSYLSSQPHYVHHKCPFVITEHDVKIILRQQHGYSSLHSDDVVIVTNLIYRMVAVCAEYEPDRR